MTYNKPEVVELGDATRVIQQPAKNDTISDGPQTVVPAYELDE